MKKTLYTILSIGILLLSVILILPVTVTSVVTVVLGGGVSCCHAAGKWGKWQRCFSGIGK